jgi:membrane fusion protein (multidrug efflux system)
MSTATVSPASIDGGIQAGASPTARSRTRPSRRTTLVVSAAVAIAVAGTIWILLPPASETTDDAYVGADVTTVAPKVRGLVAQVFVQDNQAVHAGDPLVRIDAEEFDAKVANAKADLANAQADVAAAHAALTSLDAEERLANANIAAARTAIRAGIAESDRAALDARRYDALVASGAVSQRDADRFHSGAITAKQDSARSEALFGVSQQSLNVTQAKRAGLQAALQKSDAVVLRAQAALDLALQDQRHTLIVAAIDGVIGNRQVQQGDYVQAGSRLLTLVPLHALYVTANFKETQTGRMLPGQRATVNVDALHGKPLTGVVDSLAPGSGSQFALLPFEPGTGNFTKIVQRVPVRIHLDANQPQIERLRPGLSVTAKVDVSG